MKEYYIIRKNHYYESEHSLYLGFPTEILGVYPNFESARELMYSELLTVFNNKILATCYNEENSPFHYKLQMFMKNAKGSIKQNFGFDYNGDLYYKNIDTLQEIEVLNLVYPTYAVEILLNKNDFLYSPQFNDDYFKLAKKSIPNSSFGSEYDASNHFLEKGLYLDELDFFFSTLRAYEKWRIIDIYNNLDISNKELFDKSNLINFISQYPTIFNIENNNNNTELLIIKKIDYNTLYKLNSLLKTKPFIFNKIDNKSIDEFQIKNYKKIILEGKEYMDPYNTDSIESLSKSLSDPLSLTKNLIKNILLDE